MDLSHGREEILLGIERDSLKASLRFVSKSVKVRATSTQNACTLHENLISVPSVSTLRKTLFIGAADPAILGNDLVGGRGLCMCDAYLVSTPRL